MDFCKTKKKHFIKVYNLFRKFQNIHYKERLLKRNIDPKEIEEYINNKKEKKWLIIKPKSKQINLI